MQCKQKEGNNRDKTRNQGNRESKNNKIKPEAASLRSIKLINLYQNK